MTATPLADDTDATEPIVLSDEALVQRLRDGHTDAGRALAQRYCQPLLRYLRGLGGNEHLAEELHQQTWISVLQHLDRFDARSNPGGFKAWIFRIATNKANDHWRSAGRERSAKAGLRLVSDEFSPEAEHGLQATEQMLKLRRAIDILPENQKQVVLLKYYSGLKFVEIAQLLGCPLNTALGRMHKAVLRLRQAMESENI